MRAATSTRVLAILTGVVLALTWVIFVPAGLAQAAEPAPIDNPADAVTADALPTAQINGVAWDQVAVGNTVYVAGQFTRARPAGASAGTNESPRQNLMSYNLSTGVMTTWAPQVNGRIRVITASPDGSRIYIGGTFTAVNGMTRSRVAAFNTADGSLVSGFAPAVSSDVFAITVSNSAVYLGGWFTAVNGVARTRLAAVAPNNGALLGWAPTADYTVYGLGLTAAQDRVVAAGSFQTLNTRTSVSMGTLDASTGAAYPFEAGTKLRNITDSAAMYSLKVVGTKAYSTGFGYGVGNFEGALIADAHTGVIDNMLDCHGDTYDSVPMNGLVYSVSHHHTCDNVGSYPEASPRRWIYSDAFTADARGTVATNNQAGAGYGNWAGQPVGSMVNWFPLFTAGNYTGATQAAWTVETSGPYLIQGGEFLTVNGKGQQGLVRFATRQVTTSPKVGPAGTAAELAPTLFQRTSTSVGGSIQSSWDRDGGRMTYKVIRTDKGAGAPVATLTGSSTFWNRPLLSFVDLDVLPGTTYTYYVTATDADGNSLQGASAQIRPVSTDMETGYPAQVMADQPSHFWRLGQSAGAATGPDQVSSNALTLLSGVTSGTPGALAGSSNTASGFSGSVSGRAASTIAEQGPQVFSLELWFKTTSTAGGKLLGFGNSSTGTSSSYDRQLYLDDAGRLTFGVYPGATRTLTTSGGYRDGAWHHVVATLSAQGIKLYVDGSLAASSAQTTAAQDYSGYWRIGGDTLGSWPNRGTSENVAATIDEVAVYPTELSAARVAAHRTAGRTAPEGNDAPTASFTATTASLTASLDASGSTDPDGSIANYGWDFGDGSTGSGKTATHTYTAAGSYVVRLTVVDDDGASDSTTRLVSVGSQNGQVVARDSFTRTQSRWGSASVGGVWTDSGAAYFSTDGDRGLITISAPGSGPSARLAAVNVQDVTLQTDVALSSVPTGGAVLHQVLARINGSSSYKAVLRFESTGAVRLYVARVLSGAETVLSSAPLSDLTYTAGQRLRIQLDVTGTTPTAVSARVWRASGTAPTAPQVTADDTSAPLQAAGAIGVTAYTSSAVTNTPITLSVDDLTATKPGGGGTQNEPPTAAFTVSPDELAVAVDGSGSADAEGPIASYAWSFGDGATASGAEATHTYAGSGTYTIRLTVTDADGATGTTTRVVTVSGAVIRAHDDFTRVSASGWGNASIGGAWSHNVASSFSVDGSAGVVALSTAGSTRTARLDGVSVRDVVTMVELSLDKAPAGDSYYHQLLARVNGSSLYSFTARVAPNGAIYLILARISSGTETQLKTFALGTFGYGAGESIRMQFTVSGNSPTTLSGKVWRVGGAEPAAAQIQVSDSTTELQTAGTLGMKFYAAGAMTSLPLTVRIESYDARDR